MSQLINQTTTSTNQPNNESTNQPNNESTNQPNNELTNQPNNESINIYIKQGFQQNIVSTNVLRKNAKFSQNNFLISLETLDQNGLFTREKYKLS